ncbi:TPA: fimbrial protein, partial [Providencia rettgeri]
PTCTVNGGDNDLLYNFGGISPTIIPQDLTYNGFSSLSNNLTVTCDAATFLTFKATDNYTNPFNLLPGQNSNFSSITFNLVDSSDTSRTIGGISYGYKNVMVDGKLAYLSRANDGINDNGTWAGSNSIIKNATIGWTQLQQTSVPISSLQLISGKEFSANIFNRNTTYQGFGLTYIYPKSKLADNEIDIANGVDYVGQVILTFNFGV